MPLVLQRARRSSHGRVAYLAHAART